MKRIFEYIGGIPIRLRFDNMTTAVAQVLKDGERVLTDGFTRFMLHCIFRADFCNPASGNEKGNVEKKVGYSRRNASASVPSLPRLRNLINSSWSGAKRTLTGSTPLFLPEVSNLFLQFAFQENFDDFKKAQSKKAVIPKNTVSCNSRCFWFSRRLVSFLESSEQISRFGAAFKKPPPKRRFLVHQQGLEPGTR